MRRDPLASLPSPARLWAGCALCVLPLGLVWSISPGGLTLGAFAGCSWTPSGLVCQVVTGPMSQQPTRAVFGAQASARVLLVFAALVLAYAATRPRTDYTKRLVRAATVAMAVTVALAVPARAVPAVLCQLGALALVAPLVWRRAGVFVPGRTGR